MSVNTCAYMQRTGDNQLRISNAKLHCLPKTADLSTLIVQHLGVDGKGGWVAGELDRSSKITPVAARGFGPSCDAAFSQAVAHQLLSVDSTALGLPPAQTRVFFLQTIISGS